MSEKIQVECYCARCASQFVVIGKYRDIGRLVNEVLPYTGKNGVLYCTQTCRELADEH